MKKIGILTSGGDCQSLNVAMRGVAKALYEKEAEIEIYGILDGYKGLIYGNRKKMKPSDFSGILTIGGTILGTSRQPFKQMQVPDEQGLDKVKAMKNHYRKWKLDCLGDPWRKRNAQDCQSVKAGRPQRGYPSQNHR